MKILCLESDSFRPDVYGTKGMIYDAEEVSGMYVINNKQGSVYVSKNRFIVQK